MMNFIANNNIFDWNDSDEKKNKIKNKKKNEKHDNFYRSNYLIFEGEYLNGSKWKGIAKKYKNGKLIFKREYLDGKEYVIK